MTYTPYEVAGAGVMVLCVLVILCTAIDLLIAAYRER